MAAIPIESASCSKSLPRPAIVNRLSFWPLNEPPGAIELSLSCIFKMFKPAFRMTCARRTTRRAKIVVQCTIVHVSYYFGDTQSCPRAYIHSHYFVTRDCCSQASMLDTPPIWTVLTHSNKIHTIYISKCTFSLLSTVLEHCIVVVYIYIGISYRFDSVHTQQ